MSANPLLVVAGVAYGLAGLAFTFAPQELVALLGIPASSPATWLGQMLGAALFALGFLNLFLRFTQMGGVHGRPLVVTNLSFTVIAFFASVNHWRAGASPAIAGATIVLGVMAATFGGRMLARAPAPRAGRGAP